MKQSSSLTQIFIIGSTLALLIAACFFDIWQEWLKEKAAATIELQYFNLRLWSVPLGILFFAICWFVLFQFFIEHRNKITATFLLLIGICILFYPSITMTLYITQVLGISVDYFADSVFFYSSALVAALGLIGLSSSISKDTPSSI